MWVYSDYTGKVLAMPGSVDPTKEEVEEIDASCQPSHIREQQVEVLS